MNIKEMDKGTIDYNGCRLVCVVVFLSSTAIKMAWLPEMDVCDIIVSRGEVLMLSATSGNRDDSFLLRLM
jgi:hypothetical protein